MSEFKGTKGKWELSEVNGELITTEDTNVCKIFSMELNEGQANAKLIACAPEMLEMLKTLLEEPRIRVAMKDSGENSILNDNIKKAKQLIKKATE